MSEPRSPELDEIEQWLKSQAEWVSFPAPADEFGRRFPCDLHADSVFPMFAGYSSYARAVGSMSMTVEGRARRRGAEKPARERSPVKLERDTSVPEPEPEPPKPAKGKGRPPKCPPLKGKGKGKGKMSKGKQQESEEKAESLGTSPRTLGTSPRTLGSSPRNAVGSSTTGFTADSWEPAICSPFGKRLHWVGPSYQAFGHSTIFDRTDVADTFDAELLRCMFGEKVAGAGKRHRRASFPREERGIRVLNRSRAQSMAITLKRLSFKPEELLSSFQSVDFTRLNLKGEDVERLLEQLPTPEETKQLLKHAENPGELRDIEQRVLPLCLLDHVEVKLRLIHVSMVHSNEFRRLFSRYETMAKAATEVMSSCRLCELLTLVLKTGNYINYGSSEVATGFSVKSLSVFTTYKVNGVSVLHYICRTLAGESFLFELRENLGRLSSAARESTSNQQEDLDAFQKRVAFTEKQLQQLNSTTDAFTRNRVVLLLETLRKEFAALQDAGSQAHTLGADAQCFFGDRQPMPNEEFFSYLDGFLKCLYSTADEIARNPKWFATGDGLQNSLIKMARSSKKTHWARSQ